MCVYGVEGKGEKEVKGLVVKVGIERGGLSKGEGKERNRKGVDEVKGLGGGE